jgi:hypothetical protein
MDAGFELPNTQVSVQGQSMKIPCAYDKENGTVDDELMTLVGHALWKDIWGAFVVEAPGQRRWWWEDDEVLQECHQWGTVLECGSLYAFKR